MLSLKRNAIVNKSNAHLSPLLVQAFSADSLQAQFTPAPWDYIEARTLIHIETRIDHPLGAGISICSLPKSATANANLISAAPELYHALDLMLKTHDLTCQGEDCQLSGVDMARAALKKARGET